MKGILILCLVIVVSIAYCLVMGYFTEIFFESVRLVGCKTVHRINEEEKEMVYELTYNNGRKRKIRSLIGSRMQRELEKVAQ